VVWLVEPAFDQPLSYQHWEDLIATIGLGGIWLSAFIWLLQRQPLLPRRQSQTQKLLELAHEHG
jgi:hypothetical protein